MPLKRIKIEELVSAPPLNERKPLSVEVPEVAELWESEKNRGFGPHQFSMGSNIEVWFRCPEGPDHVFQKAISSMVLAKRKGQKGCPACKGDMVTEGNSLARLFPQIAAEYNHQKNTVDINNVSYGSSRRVWWICSSCKHEWQTAISNRTQLSSHCPACSGRVSFINLNDYPSVKLFFDNRKNRDVNPARISSGKPLHWSCKRFPDHIWVAPFTSTNLYDYCPFCRGAMVSENNNLSLFPKLASEIHPTQNETTDPKKLPVRSSKKLVWLCPNGEDHIWSAKIVDRVFDGSGCPFCKSYQLCHTNSLAHMAPDVASEWLVEKNHGITPEQVRFNTTKAYWFACKNGHEYQTKVFLRTKYNIHCSICRNSQRVRVEPGHEF